MLCHCQSLQPFAACCAPYLNRELSGQLAPTPLALMRSRYSAFVLGNGDYLLATWHPDTQGSLTSEELTEHGLNCQWLGLNIIFTRIEADGIHGVVEFKVRYREQGRVVLLHEQSYFERVAGRWLYRDGLINPPKIGANQPCPCGVTQHHIPKKYKHCCAKR
ncbi:YchJ family protein [Oceanisphaera sp. W20_SRM_FM3]|uniref:YchJ family protein n=1 Tax=Oceanisphaera sp. W20_SRM_FM3 TaxID=3240267 RepID=UPI003F9BD5D8